MFGKVKAIVKENERLVKDNERLAAANNDLVATNKKLSETIEVLKKRNKTTSESHTRTTAVYTGTLDKIETVEARLKSEYAHESTLHKKPTEYMRGLKVGLNALEEAGLC